MSRKVCFLRTVLAVVGFLACLPALLPILRTRAQEPPAAPAVAPGDLIPSLRADAVLAGRLHAAQDYLRRESWAEGLQVLQSILDRTEDALVEVRSRDDGTLPSWIGIRTEAARLLGNLPAAGNGFYEASYGPQIRATLDEARQKGDTQQLAEVA